MSFLLSSLLLILLFAFELVYFKIADHFNIIDKPNNRSSHTQITIRGGGVIYVIAALILLALHAELWLPVLGLLIIGAISFADDRLTLSGKIRLLFHLIAVSMLFAFLNVYGMFSWVICAVLYVTIIGTINSYNFMDGINGINGAYSLVILLGLCYINTYQVNFVQADVIWLPILASIVFLFFNFRKKAKCFAGDVGSVTIAYWIIWLLLSLMFKTENYIYILFLAVYGADSMLTILHRSILKQNIFEAHRLHFYQLLANEHRIPHLVVASGYALLQLGIIALIIFSNLPSVVLVLLTVLPLTATYVLLKPRLMMKVVDPAS